MPIFNTSAPAFQGPTAVPNTATQIFNTTGTPIGSPTVDFPTGATLTAITLINVGAVNCFLGTSAVTAATGLILKPGEQLTIQNGTHVVAETGTTSWNLYAITASGSTTVEVSLATTTINE
jgi:hypothetical protein